MEPIDSQISKYFKRSSTKAFTDVKTTAVVLVCIYNKNGTLITHDLLHTVFSTYGKILRILVFEKMKVWKAFIEFDNVESAIEAKRNLDDFLLFSDGSRMNIYFSNLETIKFQNNNAGGIDYTLLECQQLVQIKEQGQQFEIQPLASHGSENNLPVLQSPGIKEKPVDLSEFSGKSTATTAALSHKNSRGSGLNVDEDEEDKHIFDIINNRGTTVKEMHQHEEDYRQEHEDYDKGNFDKYVEQAFFSFNQPNKPIERISSFQEIPVWQKQQQQQQREQKKGSQPPPGLNPKFNSFENLSLPSSNPQPQPQTNTIPFGKLPQSNSLTNIPQITSSNSMTNLPQVDRMNNLPQVNSMTSIPQLNSLGNMPQVSSLNSIPQVNNYSSFRNYSHNTSNNLTQQSTLTQIPQKPLLNPRFNSTPELSLSNEYLDNYSHNQLQQLSQMGQVNQMNQDLSNMSQQNLIDLIERDILTKIFSKVQSLDLNDQNLGNQSLLQDINKNLNSLGLSNLSQDSLSQFGNMDLGNMNKNTLSRLYDNLSLLLGKNLANGAGGETTNKKSQVLYVKGLEHPDIKVTMLYNIFSNFGNLLKIIFIRPKAAALLEFENSEYSTISKDYLNNIVFMGKPLRIYYSNYPIINLRNKKTSDSQEEIFVGIPKTFRFKKTKSLSINPPSSTLHISNLVKEACHENIIRNYFGAYGRIEAVKFLFMDGGKNMCHLKMASIEESLNAMAYLHDSDLGGRKIQISFTRTKI